MRNALAPVLLLATCTQAADLLVAPGGGGNMYPTISAAIAAAAPNDRILIAPQVFNEDVTINKALELVSNSSTGRYTVNRTVNLAATAPDARITISGLSAIGDLTETAPMGVGAMVTMVGCRLSRVEMLMGQGRMALYRDSIFGEVVILRGDVIGCYVSGTPDSGGILITGGSMSTETNRVIGNDIGAAMTNTSFWPIMIQPCAPFICENNLLRINMTNSSSFPLFVPNAPTPSTMPCTIRNNTFRYPDHPNAYFIKIEQSAPSFTLDIRNNLFVGPVPIDPIDVVPGSSTTEAYNVLSFDLGSIDPVSGVPTSGSPAINAGDPDAQYTDLDLTRNDAGCHGGSSSRDNFDDPLPTTAVICFVNAPRRTQTALSIPISAEGTDR